MKLKLFTNYEQIQKGDYFYTRAAQYLPRLAKVDFVADSSFAFSYKEEGTLILSGQLQGGDINNTLLLRRNEEGELEILAGENIFNTLTNQKASRTV